jgi:hypothetical protein
VISLCLLSDGKATPRYEVRYAPEYVQFYKNITLSPGGDAAVVQFSIYAGGKHRISGETELYYFSSQSKITRLYHYRGKTIGKAGYTSLPDLSSVPVGENHTKTVPSSYEAKFHMRSPEGIVIRGIFNSTLSNDSPIVIAGETHARYRAFCRFHGTISDPSALGIHGKTFTMTQVVYGLVNPVSAD